MKFKGLVGVCIVAFGLIAGVFADDTENLLNHSEVDTIVYNDMTFYKVNDLAYSKLGILRFSYGNNKVDIFANEEVDGVLIFAEQKVYFYLTDKGVNPIIEKFNDWAKTAEEKGWLNEQDNPTNKSFEKEFYSFSKTAGVLKRYRKRDGGGMEVLYPELEFHCIFKISVWECYALINIVNPKTEGTLTLDAFTATDIKVFDYILKHNKELAKEMRETKEAQEKKERDMESCFN